MWRVGELLIWNALITTIVTSLATENQTVLEVVKEKTTFPTFTGSFVVIDIDGLNIEYPYYFTWDKHLLDPRAYQMSYCADRCDGTELIPGNTYMKCKEVHCYPCDCDKPRCEIYGTCCPELSPTSDSVAFLTDNSIKVSVISEPDPPTSDMKQVVDKDEISAQNASLSVGCQRHGEGGYLYVKRCPPSFSDDLVRAKCEQDSLDTDLDVDTLIMVLDNSTQIHYRNRYCAACHGVSKMTKWELKVKCSHYLDVYKARSYDELLRLSLDLWPTCMLEHTFPDFLQFNHTCEPRWFEKIIEDCNVTGLWSQYDDDVSRACGENTRLVDRTLAIKKYSSTVYFKNVFCAICNSATYPEYYTYCNARTPINEGGPDYHLPFTLLLNFGSQKSGDAHDDSGKHPKCGDLTEWLSPDGQCLPLRCSPGKILEDGTCNTAVDAISGLGYHLSLLYTLEPEVDVGFFNGSTSETLSAAIVNESAKYIELLENKILNILEDLLVDAMIFCGVSITGNTTDFKFEQSEIVSEVEGKIHQVLQLKWLAVDFSFTANQSYSRDHVEQQLVNHFITTNMSLRIDTKETTYSIAPNVLSYRGVNLFECDYSKSMSRGRVSLRPCNFTVNMESVYASRADIIFDLSWRKIWQEMQKFLELSPTLNCPFVVFNQSEYSWVSNKEEFPPGKKVVIHFQTKYYEFHDQTDVNLMSVDDDGGLRVCQSLLNAKIQNLRSTQDDEDKEIWHWQYIFTLICLGVSMFCLILTLLTYFSFPVLRNVAGTNNIFLCLTLLLAQAFLLVSSHVMTTGPLCCAIGITTHFLWLNMFCWCFTCCLHMFLVFTADTHVTRYSLKVERKNLFIRISVCLVIPTLVVSVVILASSLTSGGNEIGYGSSICFLDSTLATILTLGIPVGIILVCNSFFFLATIRKISGVKKVEQHVSFSRADRNNLYIYLKLSSMTGTFWLVAIIGEATYNHPLRFIAIFLNGLQGVFIFLSYICNKRVASLYSQTFSFIKQARPVKTESTTDKGPSEEFKGQYDKGDINKISTIDAN